LLPLLAALILIPRACDTRTGKILKGVNTLLDSLETAHEFDTRIAYWDVGLAGDSGIYWVQGELVSKLAWEALDKHLKQDFPEVGNEVRLLTEASDGIQVNGLINNSVAHLRAEPSSKKELVTQARLGAPIRILKTEGSKSLIQVADGYMGWVNTEEVKQLDADGLKAYREAEKVVFAAQYGISYSEPNPESLPVTDLVIGNILVKVSEVSAYTQVQYPDGRLGWVLSSTLLPAEEIFFRSTLQENLVNTSLKFHGIPYLWGGTSSKNIDCSGLVCNVYFMNGMLLPRDADMQALIGKELTTEFEYDMLEPGDLLFFGRKATEEKEENVTHVALYMGGGEYIHSAGYRERVSINSMDSSQEHFIERYPEIFVRAVRLLGEEFDGFTPVHQNAFYKEIISQ